MLIVDDHDLVATSLALGLRAEGLDARACSPVAATAEDGPGLVLLDLDLGRDAQGHRIDGVTLVAPLRAAGWTVLVLSGTVDRARIGAALAEGAVAAVPKAAPFPRLLVAVRAALAGREAMSDARRQELVDLHARRSADRRSLGARLDRLTPREREVLAHLAAGHRAQAVADTFVVSLATVRSQIRAILTKLEASSQLEAVALYRRAAPPDAGR
ncbi:helix-turn-helix transcriptional regulator [Pseudonocardia abyssalis]|uniref:helix-turn-helix transcriptional regulator n=1 Tax=Pseudonocardia abyssalis TaxID=2792008 RepID=UPI001CF680BB|nr:LuxR C-terminal-related transcriptional regulator [Pseudonocardia abyssalis]